MVENNVDQYGFEMGDSDAEMAAMIERIKRRRFEENVTVVPFASSSDADVAHYPAVADVAVHQHWAGMIA